MNAARSTILAVDDERFNLNVLKNLLESEHDLLFAKNGKEALQRAVSSPPPDLILLDIMMPEMDGYEVLQRLKADPATQAIPVIFITAMGEIDDETKGLELGAVDYIIKPISPPIVQARVRTHLALKQSLEQQKEANQQLARMNEELIALNQLKNAFLGMAAHDLRNPLSSIRGLSQLLLEEKLDANIQQKFLTSIFQVSQQMMNLLNDLLDVSAIESNQFHLKMANNDLPALLRGCMEVLESKAQDKNIRLTLVEDPSMPLLAFDQTRFNQVVDNLLANAIKFSPLGSEVRIETHHEASWAGFSVQDQGPGISEADRARMFKPFQKLSATPTAGEKSTGMGLYIVKRIVDAHAGTIVVRNNPGGGSCFMVQLPVLHEKKGSQ